MSNDVVRQLERMGARGRERGASAVYAAAREDADAAALVLRQPPPVRRPARVALRAAIVVLVVALALVFAVSRQVSPGRPLVPADLLPSRIFDPRRQQVDEWLDGYDPAEIQHLYDTKDESFGEVSDELLLSTLEFRRTCRFVQRAIDAAAAAPDGEQAAAAAAVLEPQIARYRDRLGTDGNSVDGWYTLLDRIQSGDSATAQAYLANSCTDSFGPWVDD